MSNKNQKNKFLFGRYSNGLYSVYGFVSKGVLRGFVYRSVFPHIKILKLVKVNQFQYDDEFPEFRKRLNFFEKKFNSSKNISELINCIDEIVDLPKCCWRYYNSSLIYKHRHVLVEKYNRNTVLRFYSKLNNELIQHVLENISRKYSKNVLKKVTKNRCIVEDILEKNCYIEIKTYHGDNLFLCFGIYNAMSRLIQSIFDNKLLKGSFMEEIEEIMKKK